MIRVLALLSSSLLTQAPASPTSQVEERLPFVTAVHLENDVLAQADRYYSNGTRIEHYGEYDACRRLGTSLGFPEGVENRYLCGGSLAQNMYTPTRIVPFEDEVPWPDPDDRPYGGWLHGGLFFQRIHAAEVPTDSSRLTLQATVGVIGPPALAGEVQRGWHSALNDIFGRTVARIPVGWEAQLPTEPAFHVSALREQPLLWGRYVDASWSAGAMLGTVFVNASAGASVRVGLISRPFGLSPIIPSIRRAKRAQLEAEGKAAPEPGPGTTADVPERTFEAYLFARGQVRWVARNLFLDGNFFRRSLSVRKAPFVGDSEFGLAVGGRRFQFDLSYVFRSQEMAEPPNPRLSGHRFGRLLLTYRHY